MWPNPQETADLVTLTEDILNGKLHFLCSGTFTFCQLKIIKEMLRQSATTTKVKESIALTPQ